MKTILYLLVSVTAIKACASPIATHALVVNSHGYVTTDAGKLHSGELLSASSKISVPAGTAHVDLQLTGDATFDSVDSSPVVTPTAQTMVQVEPGSTLSVSKLEAIETGIETVRHISLELISGGILISARRLPALSSFCVAAPAGHVLISEGTIKVSDHSVEVASGRAVFYPNNTASLTDTPIVLTSGHRYDAQTRAVSPLPHGKASEMERQAATFHPVGPSHISPGDDFTEDCLSPVHPGHHHHRHPPHPPHPPHPAHPRHDGSEHSHPSPPHHSPGQDSHQDENSASFST